MKFASADASSGEIVTRYWQLDRDLDLPKLWARFRELGISAKMTANVVGYAVDSVGESLFATAYGSIVEYSREGVPSELEYRKSMYKQEGCTWVPITEDLPITSEEFYNAFFYDNLTQAVSLQNFSFSRNGADYVVEINNSSGFHVLKISCENNVKPVKKLLKGFIDREITENEYFSGSFGN